MAYLRFAGFFGTASAQNMARNLFSQKLITGVTLYMNKICNDFVRVNIEKKLKLKFLEGLETLVYCTDFLLMKIADPFKPPS